MNREPTIVAAPVILAALFAGFLCASLRATEIQDPAPKQTVWDGVYTAAQAARGKAVFEERCAECHNTGEAPVLFGAGFMRRWFQENLGNVFTKMRTTMPLNGPGSLPDGSYLDVLSFVLNESGFPAGTEELTANPARLANIAIVEKSGPGGPVPNFSLVQIVGCLSQGANKAWMVTNGTEPARAADSGDSPAADLTALAAVPLGKGSFRLLDFPALGREGRRGHKVQAKGFLIRQPNNEDRINPTSLQTVAESCPQ
jgi:mono/diheme cytochrome c family protein